MNPNRKVILESAKDYAKYTGERVVFYKEPTASLGWDYMKWSSWVANGHEGESYDTIVHP